jgi:hypothetical protein
MIIEPESNRETGKSAIMKYEKIKVVTTRKAYIVQGVGRA